MTRLCATSPAVQTTAAVTTAPTKRAVLTIESPCGEFGRNLSRINILACYERVAQLLQQAAEPLKQPARRRRIGRRLCRDDLFRESWGHLGRRARRPPRRLPLVSFRLRRWGC